MSKIGPEVKDINRFSPDLPICPDNWFNLEGFFKFKTHIVCIDFDCFCDICWDYKVELLD